MGIPSTMGDDYQLNTTTLIRHTARTYPEQPVVFRNDDGTWGAYTYADAYARVKRAANVLKDLGVRPGDVVGVLYWAIPGLAAVMLQMNLRLSPEDLGYVLEHSEASVVMVAESLLPVAESLAGSAAKVDTWVILSDRPMADIDTSLPNAVHLEDLMSAAEPEIEWPEIDERSAYSACYTTGTTGRPKGVYYSHRSIYLHTLAQANVLRMTDADSVMLVTPMFHASCWGMPQTATYTAAKLVLPHRIAMENQADLVEVMTRERVTVANGAPAIFQPMLDHIKTLEVKPDFTGARFLSGSTEPALSLMRDLYDLTGAEILHAYGATETTPMATANHLKQSLRESMSPEDAWDLKRCQGLTLNGVDLLVVDAAGEELPHDGRAQGEILMRGPWVVQRYHKLEDNEDRFSDGWWRSGDIGRIDEHGYLKVTDRLKDVVKSGGEWISSIDMENALMAHPRVAEAAVVGVPHPKWQERPLALVATTDGEDVDLAEIHELLAGRFARWQLPEAVIRLDSLPRTSVGKLDKKVMRRDYATLYEGAAD
jgi:fatty-acyl-CoA synthase